MPKIPVNGILLLDKPIGISSNFALQKVKRLHQALKAGHTGSLDPLATGMLPICFGKATKISHFLLDADKSYQFVMRLGVTTTTGDSEGEIIETKPIPSLSADLLNEMITRFKGPIAQIPPMFSALKHQGRPLYQLAREGKTVPRAERRVIIHHLCLDKQASDDVHLCFSAICSKGTYIRTLAEDMGKYLGCGAHVTFLRRLWVSPFQDFPMKTIEELQQSSLDELYEQLFTIEQVTAKLPPKVVVSSIGL